MIENKNETEKSKKETLRVEMFSDGVFAIAITLLALELIVMLHEKNEEGIIKIIMNHGSTFLAFFMGFCTILICWINHHHVFDYIIKVDSRLFWVNGFVLFAVTIIPFSTAVLAEYLEKEGNVAMSIFGLTFFIISLAAYFISAYTYNNHLIEKESREYYYFVKLTYGYGIIYTFLSFFVCLISVPVAVVLYILLFGVFAFPKDFAARLLKIKTLRKKKTDA